MASIKARTNGTFQLSVKNKLLAKTFWATFDTYEAAEQYGQQLERLLSQGIVPAALLEQEKPKTESWTVGRCIAEYVRNNPVPVSEVKILDTIRPSLAALSTANLGYAWAEAWITAMKRHEVLAPSTIRHRYGALARCFDWMLRRHPEILAQNPLRLLKRGFATYTDEDASVLASAGKQRRVDVERDRRLAPGEEASILATLSDRPDEKLLFLVALETAMRMRECYTLHKAQGSIAKRTIHLERSKNGYTRQVPLTSVASRLLEDYMEHNEEAIRSRGGRLLPFWEGDGSTRALDRTTGAVSHVFSEVFDAAGVPDLTFHDLRHEATCRLYERTDLSDVLIAKITGHRDPRMLRRYASLRGSDLAKRRW